MAKHKLTFDAVARGIAHACIGPLLRILGFAPLDSLRRLDTQSESGSRLPDVAYRLEQRDHAVWLVLEMQSVHDTAMPRRMGESAFQLVAAAVVDPDQPMRPHDNVALIEVRVRERSRRTHGTTTWAFGAEAVRYRISNALLDGKWNDTPSPENALLRALHRMLTVDDLRSLVDEVARWRPPYPQRRDYHLLLLGLVGRVRFNTEVVTMSQTQQQAALDYARLEGLSYDEILAHYEARWQKQLRAARSEGEAKGRREGEAKGRREGEAKGRRVLLALARRLGVSSSDLRDLEEIGDLEELQQAVAGLINS